MSRTERPPRTYKTCTGCGEQLPRNRNLWGLVWDDRDFGMCKACLYAIRLSIGYYEKNPQDLRKDRPKPAPEKD